MDQVKDMDSGEAGMIKILDRYIGGEFIKHFFLITFAFIIFFIIADFFDHADTFIKHHASFLLILSYYGLSLPGYFYQTSLFSILVATLITYTIFSKNQEIMAMRVHGINLWATTRSVIFLSAILSILIFIDGETLAPIAQKKLTFVYNTEIKKEKKSEFYFGRKKWLRWGDKIYNFRMVDPSGKTIKGITIFKMDKDFHVIERVDALNAEQKTSKKWLLTNVIWRTFEKGKPIVTFKYPKRVFEFPKLSRVSEEAGKQTKQMSFSKLKEYIEKNKADISKKTLNKYYVDLNSKAATPFGGIIMVLVAIPFALKIGRQGGISLSLGIAIGIGILYIVLSSLFNSLGYAGLLNGFLAAWSVNIIFLLAGSLAFLNLPQ